MGILPSRRTKQQPTHEGLVYLSHSLANRPKLWLKIKIIDVDGAGPIAEGMINQQRGQRQQK